MEAIQKFYSYIFNLIVTRFYEAPHPKLLVSHLNVRVKNTRSSMSAATAFILCVQRLRDFAIVLFSSQGLGCAEGRLLALGKFRRTLICFSPALAKRLKKHYGVTGGCHSCGTSCNLLFRCPQWDTETSLCKIYDNRPTVCQLFPITPADLRERDIVSKGTSCGYRMVFVRRTKGI